MSFTKERSRSMKYDNDTCNLFVEQCEDAGFNVEHYRGRMYWEGPTVRCEWSDYQIICRATTMELQHDDSMGDDETQATLWNEAWNIAKKQYLAA